ncbi:flagellar basal body protein FliL [Paenibacillus sp. FSL H8-0548]|uniref:flagellar basal body-associated FliL family protein n=1 Tax=Paenibacillus sp. FSL H8-0548 TaxID=1920422 RepID=UPI0009700A10|nr:flagellar basal body-associated FliL family protein [Paenibacillus sp. FSL H8-0548]OMF36800.1 flagellar basal body protein FliL [Paenibacillus sp. FSL H8-0548]
MKKMLPWLITILLSITLIAIVAIILFKSFFADPNELATETKTIEVKALSADQRVAVTSELKEFRRNLKEQEYFVVLSFAFQLDSKKAKEEFDKIMEIEIRPVINRTIADMTAEELQGSQGEDALESKLLNLLIPVVSKGKLIKVEITNFMITQI